MENLIECRICGGTDTADIVTPCDCRGTMGHVHERCLLLWAQRTNNFQCDVCQQRMRLVAVFREGAPPSETGVAYLSTLRTFLLESVAPVAVYALPTVCHAMSMWAISDSDEPFVTWERIIVRPILLTAVALLSRHCWREWRAFCLTKADPANIPAPRGPPNFAGGTERNVYPGDEAFVMLATEAATSDAFTTRPHEAAVLAQLSVFWAVIEGALAFMTITQAAGLCALSLFAMHAAGRRYPVGGFPHTVASFFCLVMDFAFVVGIVPIFAGIAVMCSAAPYFTWTDTSDGLMDPAAFTFMQRAGEWVGDGGTFYPVATAWAVGITLTVLCTFFEFAVLSLVLAPGVNLFVVHVREERSADGDLWAALFRDFISVPTWKCFFNGLRSVAEDVTVLSILVRIPLWLWWLTAPSAFPMAVVPAKSPKVLGVMLALAIFSVVFYANLPMDSFLCRWLSVFVRFAAKGTGLSPYLIQADRAEALQQWLDEWVVYGAGGPEPMERLLPPPDGGPSPRSPNFIRRPRPHGMSPASFHARRIVFTLLSWTLYLAVFLAGVHLAGMTETLLCRWVPEAATHHSLLFQSLLLFPHIMNLFPWRILGDALAGSKKAAVLLHLIILAVYFVVWCTWLVIRHVILSGAVLRGLRQTRRVLYYRDNLIGCRVLPHSRTTHHPSLDVLSDDAMNNKQKTE